MEGLVGDGDDENEVGFAASNVSSLVESRFLGLEPLHNVFVKLFASQLRRLVRNEDASKSCFLLNGWRVSRAEVLGVVVRRDEKNNRLLFVLDDGSGLVEVLVWERRFEREQPVDWDTIRLGMHLRVRGKIAAYLGAPQITLSSFDLLPEDGSDALLEELEQWKQIAHLNETVYSQPPARIEGAEALLEEKKLLLKCIAREAQPESELECLGAVFVYLSSNGVGSASEEELRQHVCSDAMMLRNALLTLCDQGGAFWEPGVAVATVTQIRSEENLANAVLDVVRFAGKQGIALADLVTTLHGDDRWRCVRNDSIEASLEYLSMESKIFNDGEGLLKLV